MSEYFRFSPLALLCLLLATLCSCDSVKPPQINYLDVDISGYVFDASDSTGIQAAEIFKPGKVPELWEPWNMNDIHLATTDSAGYYCYQGPLRAGLYNMIFTNLYAWKRRFNPDFRSFSASSFHNDPVKIDFYLDLEH
ncbi:hypothetical protein ACFL39_01720 [Gemmatimonadota bacterium]